MRAMTDLTFRPHHFLCALGFRGMGYSPSFVKNFKKIAQSLESNPSITVRFSMDSICVPCPHNLSKSGDTPAPLCRKQSFIDVLDRRHGNALHVRDGDILTWNDAKKRIKDNVTVEDFHRMCEGCAWKDFGVCEEALRTLIHHKG